MIKADHKFVNDLTEIIRRSVANTLVAMFNTSIELYENIPKPPLADDFVYCSDFIQEDTHAHILILFDRSLIEKLVRGIFSSNAPQDPSIYESTACEIVNVVGNYLKQYLNSNGYHLEMSIPYAPDHDKHPPAEDPLIQMAFSFTNKAAMGVDFYLGSGH